MIPPLDLVVPTPDPDKVVNKLILVVLDEQKVYVYGNGELLKEFVVSSGTSKHPTVTGTYQIYVKLEWTTMSGPGYYLENVPHTMYFFKGYGLHGTYWHNNFGLQMSHGCVNMQNEAARWLFRWTTPVFDPGRIESHQDWEVTGNGTRVLVY